MKKLIFIFVAVALVAGCKPKPQDVDAEKIFGIAEIDTSMALWEDSIIAVKGTVDHVCKHGGKKVVIVDQDSILMHIYAGEEGITSFDATLEGSEVIIWAKVKYERIDETYLNDWESRLAEQEAKVIAERDTAQDPESIDMEHFVGERQQIADLRTEVANSSEGFVKDYYLEAVKIEEVIPDEAEEVETE